VVLVKKAAKAAWAALLSQKARKLETALIVVVAGAVAKALGINV
jgi:hypothetical protein